MGYVRFPVWDDGVSYGDYLEQMPQVDQEGEFSITIYNIKKGSGVNMNDLKNEKYDEELFLAWHNIYKAVLTDRIIDDIFLLKRNIDSTQNLRNEPDRFWKQMF